MHRDSSEGGWRRIWKALGWSPEITCSMFLGFGLEYAVRRDDLGADLGGCELMWDARVVSCEVLYASWYTWRKFQPCSGEIVWPPGESATSPEAISPRACCTCLRSHWCHVNGLRMITKLFGKARELTAYTTTYIDFLLELPTSQLFTTNYKNKRYFQILYNFC